MDIMGCVYARRWVGGEERLRGWSFLFESKVASRKVKDFTIATPRHESPAHAHAVKGTAPHTINQHELSRAGFQSGKGEILCPRGSTYIRAASATSPKCSIGKHLSEIILLAISRGRQNPVF